MARCHGPDAPYGCGHHAEHVAAAHKGWRTRRRRHEWVRSEDFGHLSRIVGDVTDVHTHDTHPHSVMVRRAKKWYEIPKKEYHGLIKAGRDIARDEARSRKQREAEDRAEAARKERESRRRDKALATEAEAHERAERQREQAERRQEREREQQDRQVRAIARAEYNEVARLVKSLGGIRASYDKHTGKSHDRAEIDTSVPSSLHARSGKGLTIDRIRESVHEDFPWLNLETPNDLLDFFDKARTTRMQHAHHARQRRRAA